MLNPQAQNILDILSDGAWHCRVDWKYSDGGNKRLTDINRYLALKGQKLAWDWCDCGRHTAKIKKRKIVNKLSSKPLPSTVAFLSKWSKKEEPQKQLF